MTYRFIDQPKDQGPVRLLCETLEASPAGSYAWRHCPRSAPEQRRDALLVEIRAIHAEFHARYGSLCQDRSKTITGLPRHPFGIIRGCGAP